MRTMKVSARFACRPGSTEQRGDVNRPARRWPTRMPGCGNGIATGRRTIRGAGSATPITTPGPRASMSTTRRSNRSGARKACACRDDADATPRREHHDDAAGRGGAEHDGGRSTSSSTPPPTADRSRSCLSSMSTPANASADWSTARSPAMTSSTSSTAWPRSVATRPCCAATTPRTGLRRDGRLGR
jgi:hypothetical protein